MLCHEGTAAGSGSPSVTIRRSLSQECGSRGPGKVLGAVFLEHQFTDSAGSLWKESGVPAAARGLGKEGTLPVARTVCQAGFCSAFLNTNTVGGQ